MNPVHIQTVRGSDTHFSTSLFVYMYIVVDTILTFSQTNLCINPRSISSFLYVHFRPTSGLRAHVIKTEDLAMLFNLQFTGRFTVLNT
jgi:hypothetical protein